MDPSIDFSIDSSIDSTYAGTASTRKVACRVCVYALTLSVIPVPDPMQSLTQ